MWWMQLNHMVKQSLYKNSWSNNMCVSIVGPYLKSGECILQGSPVQIVLETFPASYCFNPNICHDKYKKKMRKQKSERIYTYNCCLTFSETLRALSISSFFVKESLGLHCKAPAFVTSPVQLKPSSPTCFLMWEPIWKPKRECKKDW